MRKDVQVCKIGPNFLKLLIDLVICLTLNSRRISTKNKEKLTAAFPRILLKCGVFATSLIERRKIKEKREK